MLQTALELDGLGKEAFVVADAVCSRTEANHANAMARLREAGVVVTNLESVLFEWLRDAAAPIEMPPAADVWLSWPVFAFTAATSIATALLFGAAPPWRASRHDAIESLRGGAKRAGDTPASDEGADCFRNGSFAGAAGGCEPAASERAADEFRASKRAVGCQKRVIGTNRGSSFTIAR